MANGDTPTKPGWQTTEFWVTICTMVISVMAMSGVITVDQQGVLNESTVQLGAIVANVAAAFGYALSRGIAKKK